MFRGIKDLINIAWHFVSRNAIMTSQIIAASLLSDVGLIDQQLRPDSL